MKDPQKMLDTILSKATFISSLVLTSNPPQDGGILFQVILTPDDYGYKEISDVLYKQRR